MQFLIIVYVYLETILSAQICHISGLDYPLEVHHMTKDSSDRFTSYLIVHKHKFQETN